MTTKPIVPDIEDEIVEELNLASSSFSSSSFKELLEQMPDVGTDEDFERSKDFGRPVDF